MPENLYSVIVHRRKAMKVEDDPINPGYEIATYAMDVRRESLHHMDVGDGMVEFVPWGDSPELCGACLEPVVEDGLCAVHYAEQEEFLADHPDREVA